MTAIQTTPCLHLRESDQGCELGRRFPQDCPGCVSYAAGINEHERQRCEVWSRVMGYYRPTAFFNAGKQQEHRDRKLFVDSPDDLSADLEGRN